MSHLVQPSAQSRIDTGKKEMQFLSFMEDIMHGKKKNKNRGKAKQGLLEKNIE